MRTRRPILIAGVAVIVAASFLFGVAVGYEKRPFAERLAGIAGQATPTEFADVDFEPFWKTWSILESSYVSEKDIDRQKLIWGAIEGMARAVGDPYTVFLPPQEKEVFESEVNGEFDGIGAEIGIRDERLVVIAPLEGSPAKRAGLLPGDHIAEIDGTSTVNMAVEEAVHHIRGKRGTDVTLTIAREKGDRTMEISITRAQIIVPAIETKKTLEGVFVIKLSSFSASSPEAFRNAIREFMLANTNMLVLDLRNNPGGYLDASVEIASWFLEEGKVVTTQESRGKPPVEYTSYGYAVPNNLHMVVLVNKGSASASEILAGALQAHGIATIMGEKTFGKGSVQELKEVTADTVLKVTVARWLTPKGISISKEGLTPDILVDDAVDEKDNTIDPMMKQAIEYLLKQ